MLLLGIRLAGIEGVYENKVVSQCLQGRDARVIENLSNNKKCSFRIYCRGDVFYRKARLSRCHRIPAADR